MPFAWRKEEARANATAQRNIGQGGQTKNSELNAQENGGFCFYGEGAVAAPLSIPRCLSHWVAAVA
jgi:hypothetical protein